MNKYAQLTHEQLEEHFSNYLIDSWSYSAVSCFARNEKAFEMQYIFRERDRSGISSVVGSAYHAALKEFFIALQNGTWMSSVDITKAAYAYLDTVKDWKFTKDYYCTDVCIAEATRRLNALLSNFATETEIYTKDIAKVLSVEVKEDAWVTINGVDIPLPLHAVTDLVVELTDGRVVIIDHKSKTAYTAEDEVALVHGQQAITYVNQWETLHPDMPISEVWFIENKSTRNSDKSNQLRKHIIVMGEDERRLYEAILYEPLRRMMEAVSNPDYIYLINKDDNLVDKAALYDFWARTQISEIEDFEFLPAAKKDLLAKRQRKIKDSSIAAISPTIITKFREHASHFIMFDYKNSNMTPEEKIQHCLRSFNISVEAAYHIDGYSCEIYLLRKAPGVEMMSIFRHQLDIAYALDVEYLRIVANQKYKDETFVSLEIPKVNTTVLPWKPEYVDGMRIPLGRTNFDEIVYWNLDNQSTPHALICGSTGSGKSVEVRCILHGAIAAGVKDITILDPKFEFTGKVPEGVTVINKIYDIEVALKQMVADMNERTERGTSRLSLVIFDEFADAAMQARSGKELDVYEIEKEPTAASLKMLMAGLISNEEVKYKENKVLVGHDKSLMENFQMLLQKGRSAGFRFVAATQRADVKTIPGTIKANLPIQICFRLPKGLDSKVVLDSEGAEALSGNGDGLLNSPDYKNQLVRFQGFFYDEKLIKES